VRAPAPSPLPKRAGGFLGVAAVGLDPGRSEGGGLAQGHGGASCLATKSSIHTSLSLSRDKLSQGVIFGHFHRSCRRARANSLLTTIFIMHTVSDDKHLCGDYDANVGRGGTRGTQDSKFKIQDSRHGR
jgi:hypothetical protein